MDRLERILAATNNAEMSKAVIHAQAERVMIQLGLKHQTITAIQAGAAPKLSAADVDAAMEERAKEHADQINEKLRISKNVKTLDPCDVFTVDRAKRELYPMELSVRMKNSLLKAGLLID